MASRGKPSRHIFYKASDEIDEFMECMNEVKHALRVSYYLKRRDYGCKIIIIVRKSSTSSTIMYSLTKLRSLTELPMFKANLEGIKSGVNRYLDSLSDSTDTSDS